MAAALFAAVANGAGAMELSLPGLADLVSEDRRNGATVDLPVGPWTEDGIETIERSGTVTRRVWRMRETDATTLQLYESIATQIEQNGFSALFQCHDKACGGFDFRFQLDIIGEPDMHVDLGNYRYLLAQSGARFVSAVISRSESDGYLHLLEITPAENAVPLAVTGVSLPVVEAARVDPEEPGLARDLERKGRTQLPDLAFAAGSVALDDGPFASLKELAVYLEEKGDERIILVGHTDADGALNANIALSRQRAAAVRERLINEYGIAANRVRAEGVGYLSPIASNATPEGREANRRVEVILDN